MKFGDKLGTQLTPEWRTQYIQYEIMKEMIYSAVDGAPSTDESDDAVLLLYFRRQDENFLQFCQHELQKVNTFFAEKIAEAKRKFESLKDVLGSVHQTSSVESTRISTRLKIAPSRFLDPKRKQKVSNLYRTRLAFSEFYLSLVLLQNYQILNYTGFRKILKKHDKVFETATGAQWMSEHVDQAAFNTCKDVDHLITQVEDVVAKHLEAGDKKKAMKRLRVPPLGAKEKHPGTTFRVGFLLGAAFTILVFCVVEALNQSRMIDPNLLGPFVVNVTGIGDSAPVASWIPTIRIFRGFFIVILHGSLVGLNIYGWRKAGVNHVLIFELDPRNHLSSQEVLEICGFLAVCCSGVLLCHLYRDSSYLARTISPLTYALILVLFMLNPIDVFQRSARFWLLRVLFRIVTAPFHQVKFADFWLADQLNSMAAVFIDSQYLICVYASQDIWNEGSSLDMEDFSKCSQIRWGIVPLILCLPAWFRFAQCLRRYRDSKKAFPHLVNAGKYSTTFFVILFDSLYKVTLQGDKRNTKPYSNYLFYLWIFAAVISSIYAYIWDIRMDWGLLDRNAGRDNRFLREQVVYRHKWYYYVAMVLDFFLRLSWTMTFSIATDFLNREVLNLILAVCEVFRRFVWNFFRLENEHLNNCGEFRAVRDIAIMPMKPSDLERVEAIMDFEEGAEEDRLRNKYSSIMLARSSRTLKTDDASPILMENDSATELISSQSQRSTSQRGRRRGSKKGRKLSSASPTVQV